MTVRRFRLMPRGGELRWTLLAFALTRDVCAAPIRDVYAIRCYFPPEDAPRVLLKSDFCVLESVPAVAQANKLPAVWRDYWLVSDADAPLLASRRRPEGKAALRCLVRVPAGRVAAASGRSPPVGTSLLLSDDLVNVWEFRLRPGESFEFHTHTHAYMFTNLATSETIELDEAGAKVGEARRQVDGQTVFVQRDALGSHGVLNSGETTFLQFIVELKQQGVRSARSGRTQGVF